MSKQKREESHIEEKASPAHSGEADKKLTVSVVIPTIDRYKFLQGVLADLCAQTRPADEVIVVDQSQDCPEGRALYKEFADKLPLTVIRSEPLGTSAARNLGLKEVSSDIVLFLDDDVRFDHDLVQLHVENYRRYPIDAVHGGVTRAGRELHSNRLTGNYDAISVLTMSPNVNYRSMTIGIGSLNISIRREVALNIGGFDETLRGLYDDRDFGLRLYLGGAIVIYDPAPRVYHYKAKEGGRRSVEKEGWTLWAGPFGRFRPSKFKYRAYFYAKYRRLWPRSVKWVLFDSLLWLLTPTIAHLKRPWMPPVAALWVVVGYIQGLKMACKWKSPSCLPWIEGIGTTE